MKNSRVVSSVESRTDLNRGVYSKDGVVEVGRDLRGKPQIGKQEGIEVRKIVPSKGFIRSYSGRSIVTLSYLMTRSLKEIVVDPIPSTFTQLHLFNNTFFNS